MIYNLEHRYMTAAPILSRGAVALGMHVQSRSCSAVLFHLSLDLSARDRSMCMHHVHEHCCLCGDLLFLSFFLFFFARIDILDLHFGKPQACSAALIYSCQQHCKRQPNNRRWDVNVYIFCSNHFRKKQIITREHTRKQLRQPTPICMMTSTNARHNVVDSPFGFFLTHFFFHTDFCMIYKDEAIESRLIKSSGTCHCIFIFHSSFYLLFFY